MNYNLLNLENIGEHFDIFQHLLIAHIEQQKQSLTVLLSLLSVNDQNRCMARIHDKTQCTRKCKDNNSRLCGSHINSLPYGRVDDTETCCINNDRKTKPNQLTNPLVDLSKYIKTELIHVNDKELLIDQNNLLFDYNEGHTLVGIKLSENNYKWL